MSSTCNFNSKISTRDSPGLMLLRRQVRRTPQTQTLSRWATATLCLSLNYSNHRLSVAQAEERGAFGSKGFYESLVLRTARRRNNCLKTCRLRRLRLCSKKPNGGQRRQDTQARCIQTCSMKIARCATESSNYAAGGRVGSYRDKQCEHSKPV